LFLEVRISVGSGERTSAYFEAFPQIPQKYSEYEIGITKVPD